MRNRLERALKILGLLQSKQGHDPISLSSALDVNRRTVYRDIAMLKGMGIGIQFDPEKRKYVIDGLRHLVDRHGERTELSALVLDAIERSEHATPEMTLREIASVLSIADSVERGTADLREPSPRSSGKKEPLSQPVRSDRAARLQGIDAGLQEFDQAKTVVHGPDRSNCWLSPRQHTSSLVFAIDHHRRVEVIGSDTRRPLQPVAVRPHRFEVGSGDVVIYWFDESAEWKGAEMSMKITSMRLLGDESSQPCKPLEQ
ncbi:MAG: HTH domain-containing protein [Planctomycetota bacterium]